MKKYFQKDLILLLCAIMLLSLTSISIANGCSISSTNPIWAEYNTHDPGIALLSLGVVLVIGNSGDYIVRDIEWTSNANSERGTIVFGDGVHGRIPAINPGETYEISLRPVPLLFTNAYDWSPVGFGEIYLVANAQTSTGDSTQVEKPAFLLGPFLVLAG